MLGLYFFNKQRRQKQRLKQLLNQLNTSETAITETIEAPKSQETNLNIPDDTVQDILKALQTFEQQTQFTDNTLTLNTLSKTLNTNSTYLSKVINTYKNKSFNNYLNDLRIDYVTKELYHNHKLRQLTIRAIADEVGFNNPESFSKAFYKHTGIYPSYFIKQIEKEHKKDSASNTE